MTTLFLLFTGVCQSLNELGVASVTKKWSGPAGPLATAEVCVSYFAPHSDMSL